MNYRHFQNLKKEAQEKIFIREAVLIAERNSENYYYHLYQLGGFYIEVGDSRSVENTETFTAFESMKLLDPYLELIVLDGVV